MVFVLIPDGPTLSVTMLDTTAMDAITRFHTMERPTVTSKPIAEHDLGQKKKRVISNPFFF